MLSRREMVGAALGAVVARLSVIPSENWPEDRSLQPALVEDEEEPVRETALFRFPTAWAEKDAEREAFADEVMANYGLRRVSNIDTSDPAWFSCYAAEKGRA